MTSTASPTTRLAPAQLTRLGDLGILILRIALGVVFVLHGAQKLFGAFGGGGIAGTAGFFEFLGATPGSFWAVVVGLVEFLGGLALIFGFLARLASLAIAVDMIMAIVLFNGPKGFFTESETGGWEFNGVLLAGVLAVALIGVGRVSVAALAARSDARVARFVARA